MLNDLSINLNRQGKSVIIDASHGGDDSGLIYGNITEKELTLDISRSIYNILNNAGINVTLTRDSDMTIPDNDRINKILNVYGDTSDVILISNQVDSDEDTAQIVYALRDDNTLSDLINTNLINVGLKVKEPYQRRLESNTALDYYSIHRNTKNLETVLINYGSVEDFSDIKNNSEKYAKAVADAIISYLGVNNSNFDNYYIVKAGDTLYSIARKYGISVDELKKMNDLSSNFLTIGQKLIVKQGYNNQNNQNTNNQNNIYIVKSQDTLYSIAKNYNTTVDEIKKLNNLTDTLLSIGQILKLPDLNKNEEYILYTVNGGDTLYSIANKYNTTVNEIKIINNLVSNILSIGQILKIPITQTQNNNLVEDITYIVKKGDNLYNLAKKYNTTVKDIMNYNNLNSNLLSIGQILKIPTYSKIVYIVKKGDNLYSIAKQYNTTVDEIKKNNNLTSNIISINQQLII